MERQSEQLPIWANDVLLHPRRLPASVLLFEMYHTARSLQRYADPRDFPAGSYERELLIRFTAEIAETVAHLTGSAEGHPS